MRYFEDIPLDYRCLVGTFVLSEAAIIDFARAWDPQPFHTDPEAARASVFGGLVASSAHLFAICTRLFFDHADPIRVVAMLGKDKLRLPNPARAGTTLTYETRCMDKCRLRQSPRHRHRYAGGHGDRRHRHGRADAGSVADGGAPASAVGFNA